MGVLQALIQVNSLVSGLQTLIQVNSLVSGLQALIQVNSLVSALQALIQVNSLVMSGLLALIQRVNELELHAKILDT